MKVYCKHGHERTEKNIYTAPKTGYKGCRVCRSIAAKKSRPAQKPAYQMAIDRDRLHFDGLRERAIQRDDEQCVKCEMTREEHRRRFNCDITVDHIDNNGIRKPRKYKNNTLENLQTLCIPCHARKDNRQNKLTDIQVINIRHCKGSATYAELARLYGVSSPYISQLMNNQWRTNI